MTRSLDYGNLMHRAMRGLIKDVLQDVAQNGLPGIIISLSRLIQVTSMSTSPSGFMIAIPMK